ncbi:MAG: hypothetical protein O3B47_03160 [bacterium]|nr:hypothetical protein [bacterium]
MRKGYCKLSKDERALHEQFVEFGGDARKWINECKLLLLKIQRMRIWEKRGFSSLYEYSCKLAGISERLVDDSLWILKGLENKPELMKVAKEKSLSAVRQVVSVATEETDEFWAEKVRRMSISELRVYVNEWRLVFEADSDEGDYELFPETKLGNGVSLRNVTRSQQESLVDARTGELLESQSAPSVVQINPAGVQGVPSGLQGDSLGSQLKTRLDLNSEPRPLKVIIPLYLKPEIAEELCRLNNDDWNEPINELLKLRREMLERERPVPVKTKSRYVPALIKRFVLKRANCKCEFPGCAKQYFELHHADRFGVTWLHDPARLFALCSQHHQLAHQGLINNEDKNISEWSVRADVDDHDLRYGIDQLVTKFRRVAPGA